MSADIYLIASFLLFITGKGYGFIAREGGPDLFVHTSAIQSEGFRNHDEGRKVEFEVGQGNKCLQATNVAIR